MDGDLPVGDLRKMALEHFGFGDKYITGTRLRWNDSAGGEILGNEAETLGDAKVEKG